jgi:hypothetical protein
MAKHFSEGETLKVTLSERKKQTKKKIINAEKISLLLDERNTFLITF